MGYNPQNQELVSKEWKRLNKQLSICVNVQQTLETAGWIDTIAPTIDRMIIDVVGGKIKDVWTSGKLSKAKTDERREYYIGYKQALIDLHNRITLHIDQIEVLKDQLKSNEDSKKERYKIPLVEDTRYAP